MKATHLEIDSPLLRVHWENGLFDEFHFLWLHDNDPCFTLENGQKTTDPKAIGLAVNLQSATIDQEQQSLRLVWQGEGNEQAYDLGWLHQHRYSHSASQRWTSAADHWKASDVGQLPEFPFAEIVSKPQVLREFLQGVRRFGIAFVAEMPTDKNALLALIDTFGYVRETNYGPTFDVRTVAVAENLAYTSIGLPVHTDNPYRNPVPGLQCLQVLCNDADGGDSLFVDGFAAAEALRNQSTSAFDLLANRRVTFRYRSADVDLIRSAPILQLDGGVVAAVNFNSRSIQPLNLPNDELVEFYDAYRRFARLLESDEFCIRRKLPSGSAVLFNNLRLLHGRTAFSNGNRHLHGCYADIDGLFSTIRVLEREALE